MPPGSRSKSFRSRDESPRVPRRSRLSSWPRGRVMLDVQNLRKRFGEKVAVDGVSFRVGPGEVVGLLGPNGAGKTTTVAMICGLIAPDEGQVLVDGRAFEGDTDPARRKLGLVPQELA